MQLSIVSPAPHYPGNSGLLAGTYLGDLQNIVFLQTWDLPQGYAGRYFIQKGQKYYPGSKMSKNVKNVTLQSRAVPGAIPWMSQSTKLNPGASPRYPRLVGGRGYIW